MTDLVNIGKILGAHGIHGWVKILPLTDDPERFLDLRRVTVAAPGGPAEIRDVRDAVVNSGGIRILLGGVNDCETAAMLRGRFLQVPRAELPELPPGTYYTHDLIGLRVETEEGEFLGNIKEVMQTGSNDVYVIRHPETGAGWMAPALKRAVVSVNLGERLMTVRKDWIT